MPEHLKALIVILVLAAAVFAYAKRAACAAAGSEENFARRRNLWFGITLAVFLAHNFWFYLVVTALLVALAVPREPNKLAMYFFVLFAVPAISAAIPGMGIINQFFTIDYLRLLALTILAPAFLVLQNEPDAERFGRSLPDKLIAAYIVLQFLLMLNISTFTNTLRHGVFYACVDIFLPYYVASRSLKNLAAFRDALMAFTVAALVLSATAVFEFARHWLLYKSLDDALGIGWNMNRYLQRGEVLRVSGSTGHPIVLGYVMTVAIAFMLHLRTAVAGRLAWIFGLAWLVAGLLVPVSRGPWLGAAAMLLVFIASGPSAARGYAKLGLVCAIGVPLLLASPAGHYIVDYLPFVGTVSEDTVTYRQRLAQISVQVILQNPFFGAYNYIYSAALQELKQGEGIIDIVNSYLAVGLGSGLVGLALFTGFFVVVAAGIYKSMKALTDRGGEAYLLGRVLLSALLGILVIIATVSSISVIPVIYWTVAGLGVAYARMVAPARVPHAAVFAGTLTASVRRPGYAQLRAGSRPG